jgi:hypothetical protein
MISAEKAENQGILLLPVVLVFFVSYRQIITEPVNQCAGYEGFSAPRFRNFPVASRPKIFQTNSKPAVRRKRLAVKIGGRTTVDFEQKRPTTDRPKKTLTTLFLRRGI